MNEFDVEYDPKYMVIRIINILGQFKDDDSFVTEECWTMMEKDFKKLDDAFVVKDNYRCPEHYIVIPYYE